MRIGEEKPYFYAYNSFNNFTDIRCTNRHSLFHHHLYFFLHFAEVSFPCPRFLPLSRSVSGIIIIAPPLCRYPAIFRLRPLVLAFGRILATRLVQISVPTDRADLTLSSLDARSPRELQICQKRARNTLVRGQAMKDVSKVATWNSSSTFT